MCLVPSFLHTAAVVGPNRMRPRWPWWMSNTEQPAVTRMMETMAIGDSYLSGGLPGPLRRDQPTRALWSRLRYVGPVVNRSRNRAGRLG